MITISLKTQSERSGIRSGAGRKTSERERSGEQDSKKREWSGARKREIGERERSGERKSKKSGWNVERHFSPLPLRSYALLRVTSVSPSASLEVKILLLGSLDEVRPQ
jgi:hypothetical protein